MCVCMCVAHHVCVCAMCVHVCVCAMCVHVCDVCVHVCVCGTRDHTQKSRPQKSGLLMIEDMYAHLAESTPGQNSHT